MLCTYQKLVLVTKIINDDTSPVFVVNGLLQANQINIMAADDLAPGVARSSAAMALTIWNVAARLHWKSISTTSCILMLKNVI